MFGLIKRSTHEAEMANRDERIDALHSALSKRDETVEALRDQLAFAHEELRCEQTNHATTASLLADKCREARQIGKALNEMIAERDALRDAAAAKRAKQLANLRNQPKLEQAA